MADNTTPWIGVSQYKTPKFKETKPCKASTVTPEKVDIRGKEHTALVTHVCIRDRHNADDPKEAESYCQCICDLQFLRNFKNYED